jgi:hypothetical protein
MHHIAAHSRKVPTHTTYTRERNGSDSFQNLKLRKSATSQQKSLHLPLVGSSLYLIYTVCFNSSRRAIMIGGSLGSWRKLNFMFPERPQTDSTLGKIKYSLRVYINRDINNRNILKEQYQYSIVK